MAGSVVLSLPAVLPASQVAICSAKISSVLGVSVATDNLAVGSSVVGCAVAGPQAASSSVTMRVDTSNFFNDICSSEI
jgi:hypothetical protein